MESASVDLMKPRGQNSWFWFFIQLILFGGLYYLIVFSMNISEVSRNWPKYRCNPTIMPFAGAYGYNAADNFNYCMKNIFNGQVGSITGPFSGILTGMLGTLMTFLKNINSFRLMLATLLTGISKIFQEFIDRFKLLFMQLRTTSSRIQFLMKRVFATFLAIIYMGSSGVTAGLNFGDTFLFRFLDTFCFSDETLVNIEGKGKIPIKSVELGDRFTNGALITAKYTFLAYGQPMVKLGDIEVSTNHYVMSSGNWVRSEDHPSASDVYLWSSKTRPLICLDTDRHEIPIGDYVFSDYMEDDSTDCATMGLIDYRLNNVKSTKSYNWGYESALCPDTRIQCKNGNKPINDIQLGETLTNGKVFGKVERLVKTIVKTDTLECSASQLVWDGKWVRAGHKYPVIQQTKRMVNLFVDKTGTFETQEGHVLRDTMELHSPDIELPTASSMLDSPKSRAVIF